MSDRAGTMDECLIRLTCLFEVHNASIIYRKESYSGSILWAHVGNGSPVCNGKLGYAWTKELYKLSYHSHLP